MSMNRDLLKIGTILSLVSASISLSFADPINWPKQIALISTLPYIAYLVFKDFPKGRNVPKLPAVLILFFIFSGVISAVLSNENWMRTFWGTFGRNNGLVTFIAFGCLILIGYIISLSASSYISIFFPLIILAIVSAFYGILQLRNLDPIEWSTGGQAFAFFGNINFASAIFGLGAILVLALIALNFRSRKKLFVLIAIYSLLTLVTWFSNSIQGVAINLLFIFILTLIIVGRINKLLLGILLVTYTLGASIVGLGLVGFGPLGERIYQYTFELRLKYLYTGLKMGFDNPVTGVGVDSYGDWYRNFRDLDIIGITGVDLTVNNAHSAPIQIFATVGIFPFLAVALLYIIAITKSMTKIFGSNHDLEQKLMAAVFLAVTVNSFVSIDNISVGIWNYLLLGLNLSAQKPTQSKGIHQLNNSKRSLNVRSAYPAKLISSLLSAALFGISWTSSYPDRKVVSLYQNSGSTLQSNSDLQRTFEFQKLATSSFMTETHFRLVAEALSQLGQNEAAISVLKTGITRFSRDYQLNDYLAVFLERTNRKEEAVKVREAQLKLDPIQPQVWLFYALDLSDLERDREAEIAFAKAVSLRNFLSDELRAKLPEYEKLIID